MLNAPAAGNWDAIPAPGFFLGTLRILSSQPAFQIVSITFGGTTHTITFDAMGNQSPIPTVLYDDSLVSTDDDGNVGIMPTWNVRRNGMPTARSTYKVVMSNNAAVNTLGSMAKMEVIGVGNFASDSGDSASTLDALPVEFVIARTVTTPFKYEWVDKTNQLAKPPAGVTGINLTYPKGSEVLFTKDAALTAYTAVEWQLNGVKISNEITSPTSANAKQQYTTGSGQTFHFYAASSGTYNLTLLATKDGYVYSTNFAIKVN